MSAKQRGQEATIRVQVDGQTQEGSFFKVNDFKVTPRTDLNEKDYLGEQETDIDIQHHGFDLSWSVDNTDSKTLEFLSTIVDREANHERHPSITVMVIYAYREPGASDKTEVYRSVFIKVAEQGFAGRKENVKTSFEGKCKKRSLLTV
jgi:hypothetical protein